MLMVVVLLLLLPLLLLKQLGPCDVCKLRLSEPLRTQQASGYTSCDLCKSKQMGE